MSREQNILAEIRSSGNLRELHTTLSCGALISHGGREYINLSSNDYLGLTESGLQREFLAELSPENFVMSNPSSRLMTGNSPDYEQLEHTLATMYGTEAALVVGSGFLLNSGVLPAVTTQQDLVLADKLMHASLIDGMRLSSARFERFRHNDMDHLEKLLQKADNGKVIVATESLFSMDGDRAPLHDIAWLQKRYGFELYLDEAHAIGVWGTAGRGFAVDVPQLRVDYLVATFGKAICSQGAFVACSTDKKELLVNRMRTLIFSTALPPISLQWTQYILDRLESFAPRREHLYQLIGVMNGQSQIIPKLVGENHATLKLARELREAGYWATAIRQPTVPPGTARLRFSLTAAHTHQQIAKLCSIVG